MDTPVTSPAHSVSPLRLWAHITCGAAIGLTYGMLTTSSAVLSGCLHHPTAFCGLIGGILNLPAWLISEALIPEWTLFNPLLRFTGVLLFDGALGSLLGFLVVTRAQQGTMRWWKLPALVFLVYAIPAVLTLLITR